MRESIIEKDLRVEVEARGGKCWKFKSPSQNGVPDRIIFLPGQRFYMVETKGTEKGPRLNQRLIHRLLRRMGFEVYVIQTPQQLTDFLILVDNG